MVVPRRALPKLILEQGELVLTDSNSNQTKSCSKCHRELPLKEFHKHATGKNGVQSKCRDCVKAYRKAYYQKHQERLQEYSKEFYGANREHVLNYQQRYAAENKSRIISYRKQWYASNRDILLEIKRQDYQVNKEHYNEISRKNWHAHKKRNAARRKIYEAANPDLIRFHKSQHEARKKNAVGSCTSGQWRQKCAYHGWRCIYCRVELAPKTVTTEHRKPLARGGSNWPANLGPCCAKCNQSKNNKSEKEYRAYICFQKLKVLSTAARVVIAKPRNATGLLPIVLRRT